MAEPPGEPVAICHSPRPPSGARVKTSVGAMELRGRLPGSSRLATGMPSANGLPGEIGELVVEEESAHHAKGTEGRFDRGRERDHVAFRIDHGEVGRAVLLDFRAHSVLRRCGERRSGRCHTEAALVLDEPGACSEIVRVEQSGDRTAGQGHEVGIGHVAVAVGKGEPLGLGDPVRRLGIRQSAFRTGCRRMLREGETFEQAQDLPHGEAAGGRRTHAAHPPGAIRAHTGGRSIAR